jgi:transposase
MKTSRALFQKETLMNKRIIGIDLAVSAKHKAIVLDPACNQFIGNQITFRARPADLDRLLHRARKDAPKELSLIAILEATGMAWYPVAVYLQRHDVTVYRVNGQKTKDFRRALWRHAGSDRIDSRVLAHLYQIAPDRLEQCPLPDGELLALQRACRAYARWREQDVAEQNRMQDIDKWAWDNLYKLVPAIAQPWMRQHWYNPWRVQEAGEGYLALAWQAAATKLPADTDWVAPWVDRARQMTALYSCEAQAGYGHLQETMRHSLNLRERYAQEQKALSKGKIIPLYRQLFPDCPLPTIKGVGIQSAATYRAFIQDMDRFRSVEKFRLWCGIVPRSKQSGDGEAKGMPITKAGPNLVKATLYLNAEVARQWDVQLAFIYHKQMVEYGKHHKKAVIACASHLASRIYAVLKEQRPYQLRDLKGNPISEAMSRDLCLQYKVPDEVRKRNNKRFRRNQAAQTTEKRMHKRMKRR